MPAPQSAPAGVRRRSRLLVFLSVLGPGLIAAAAGNEAGGVLTYSQIGATHGFGMLWLLLASTASLIVAQEMCTRMGLVTGKGLADLIREEFGVRVAVFAMAVLCVANLFTTFSEFAGITAAVEMLVPVPGIRYGVVPLLALGLWLLVVRGSYRKVERLFLALCAVYLVYVVAAWRSVPDWGVVWHGVVSPGDAWRNPDYMPHAIALIGTTIAPWMQFYVQSSVRDKGLRPEHYAYERLDVLIGSLLSNLVSFCIVVACAATLFTAGGGGGIGTVREAAEALRPAVQGGAFVLFAIGLFNASAVGAVVVPLSTAYAVTEAIGSESGLGRKAREAPLFLALFTGFLVVALVVVLLTPEERLLRLVAWSQILNGVLLPVILVLMLRLVNRRRLMGRFVNTPAFNAVAWLTVALVAVLSLWSAVGVLR
jgi:NRAMP (natural resistance-associated macrophage protein)-like metal ion transporter